MPMTNKARIAQYDSVKADRDQMQLVFFDYVNGRFDDCQTVIDCRAYDTTLAKGTKLKLKASWRAMPLFLIHWYTPGQNSWTPYWMDETAMEELVKHNCPSETQRMLRDGYLELKRQYQQNQAVHCA